MNQEEAAKLTLPAETVADLARHFRVGYVPIEQYEVNAAEQFREGFEAGQKALAGDMEQFREPVEHWWRDVLSDYRNDHLGPGVFTDVSAKHDRLLALIDQQAGKGCPMTGDLERKAYEYLTAECDTDRDMVEIDCAIAAIVAALRAAPEQRAAPSERQDAEQSCFESAVRPLILWLNNNCHPHTTVIVDQTSAEVVEGVRCFRTNDYLRD